MVLLKREVRLFFMLGLTSTLFLVEIIVGYMVGSIALIADSFHMLSDLLALIVAAYAVRVCFYNEKENTINWLLDRLPSGNVGNLISRMDGSERKCWGH